MKILNPVPLQLIRDKREISVHKNQSHILALSLATFFLFIVTQFGWPTWAEKLACFQDITLSISIDPVNGEPESFSKVGLPSAEFRTALLVPALLLEKSFQGLIHLCLLYEGLKSRSPPTLLST
jgi:hypothetical protein